MSQPSFERPAFEIRSITCYRSGLKNRCSLLAAVLVSQAVTARASPGKPLYVGRVLGTRGAEKNSIQDKEKHSSSLSLENRRTLHAACNYFLERFPGQM